MKKRELVIGLVTLFIGIGCLIAGVFFETNVESQLGAIAGICLVWGIRKLRDYRYWSAPENRERYQEILENERMENHDELKEKVRDKSGRYAYQFGLYTICFLVALFEILRASGVIGYDLTRAIVVSLGGYLILQVIAERVIFRHLMKKY